MTMIVKKKTPFLDALSGVGLVVLATYVISEASGFRGNSGFLPTILAWIIGVGGAGLVVFSGVSVARDRAAGRQDDSLIAGSRGSMEIYILPPALLLLTVAFVFLIPRLGYYLTSVIYIPAVLYLLGTRNWVVYIATAGFFVILLYVVFDVLLSVSFPVASWL